MEEINTVDELRKELNGLKKKDPNVKLYIEGYEAISGLSIKSSKTTAEQLNDCIIFCMTQQYNKEQNERKHRGGII